MRTSTLLLATGLIITLAGGAWLYRENATLRGIIGTMAPAVVAKPVTNASDLPGLTTVQRSPAAAPTSATATPGWSSSSLLPPPSLKFAVAGNPDGTVTLTDPASGNSKALTLREINELAQQARAAALEHVIRKPDGPSWSPGQAAGAPNTEQHGDFSTAWASQSPDKGKEWLQLRYQRAVEVGEINIHETYNPGAVSKVSAILPDGGEKVIWEGTETVETGIVERALKVPPGIRCDQIRIELDTARVPGWNEIDAVELVGRDGSRQWAAESTASSYFGTGSNTQIEMEGLTGKQLTRW